MNCPVMSTRVAPPSGSNRAVLPAVFAAPAGPLPGPETDARYMAAALALGRRNRGMASPNPAVGCLIVRFDTGGGRIVGRGWTAIGGRPHAERIALADAGEAARGATCYVSLEPCSHHGRTTPCSDALIESGVARVVSALEDPDPRVAGGGHEALRAAGIDVTVGVCAREARRDNAGHISRIRTGRPHVMLKLAVSADGFIGRAGEGQVAITGPAARREVQILRAEHDAILVGSGTALADDPLLTVRLEGLEDHAPVRVVLDGLARLSLASNLVRTISVAPLWVVVREDAPAERREALARAGATIIPVAASPAGRLDIDAVLLALGSRGITTVMVEGGADVARSLRDAGRIDEAVIFTAPTVIGKGGIAPFGDKTVGEALVASGMTIDGRARFGDDTMVRFWRD